MKKLIPIICMVIILCTSCLLDLSNKADDSDCKISGTNAHVIYDDYYCVDGLLTNKVSEARSSIRIQVDFIDNDENVIGSGSVYVGYLSPGKTSPFSVLISEEEDRANIKAYYDSNSQYRYRIWITDINDASTTRTDKLSISNVTTDEDGYTSATVTNNATKDVKSIFVRAANVNSNGAVIAYSGCWIDSDPNEDPYIIKAGESMDFTFTDKFTPDESTIYYSYATFVN